MTGPQGFTKKMSKKNRTAIATRAHAVQSQKQSEKAQDIKSTGLKRPGEMTFQSKRETGKKRRMTR